jgi:hypothetical protein
VDGTGIAVCGVRLVKSLRGSVAASSHTVERILPPIVVTSAEQNIKPQADRRMQVRRDAHPATLHR